MKYGEFKICLARAYIFLNNSIAWDMKTSGFVWLVHIICQSKFLFSKSSLIIVSYISILKKKHIFYIFKVKKRERRAHATQKAFKETVTKCKIKDLERDFH